MDRRTLFKSLAAAPALLLGRPGPVQAQLPRGKITRVRIYTPPTLNPLFNQSNMICTVETDMGITGIGEGGSKDTLEQCAGTLIGKDPFKIEAIWQEMFIAWFYPPGREKTHAMGAMDLALWDIKGKALKLPVHELLGGTVRNYCECYGTTFMPPPAAGAKPADAARSRQGRDGRGLSRVSHGRRRPADRQRLQHAARPSTASSRSARKSATASGRTATGASTSTSDST